MKIAVDDADMSGKEMHGEFGLEIFSLTSCEAAATRRTERRMIEIGMMVKRWNP